MKRKLYILLISLMMMFSLSSCETYTYATTQDDIYVEAEVDVVRSNVSFDVIIRYGTPYYRDGVLLYYLYHDIYYYPFYYNNYWYVRAYRRPFTHFDRRPYFRPHRYDYRFSPGQYRGFERNGVIHNRPNQWSHHERRPNVNTRPNNERRPNVNTRPNNERRPNVNTRPNNERRPNVRQAQPNRQVQPNRPSQPNRSAGSRQQSRSGFGGPNVSRRR